ncbi:MAG: DUF11 domain-containing protein, partial [Faecalibacterium sp.]|nr:DUF11 domain-containing protein [Faecalibacterium sp.]
MKQTNKNPIPRSWRQRAAAFAMALVMAASYVPASMFAFADNATGQSYGATATVADPETLTRPNDVFHVDAAGNRVNGSTLNSGKVLVGKSVTDGALDLSSEAAGAAWNPAAGNFLVTVSQSAQSHGVSSQIPVPLDVVFVIDTSGSMNTGTSDGRDRADDVMAAANSAISTLLSLNENNRIAVVGFSNHASVLSPLGHYDDSAATSHLTVSNGNLRGRNANGTVNTSGRNIHDGGTNIQAGIIAGAKLLTADSVDTTVTVDTNNDGTLDTTVNRMPFLVILSDGAPTYAYTDATWWNPYCVANNTANYSYIMGDGNISDPGVGFLAALSASYYKNQITQKYYGANAAQSANIYTIGVGLTVNNNDSDADRASKLAAQVTLDPLNNLDSATNTTAASFRSYMSSYISEGTQSDGNFSILVNDGGNTYYQGSSGQEYYNFYNYNQEGNRWNNWQSRTDNIENTVTGLKYNDAYWSASSTTEINNAFRDLIIEIQLKALASPTYISTAWGEDFSGYVTFTDPIGEYMEVKDIKGVLGEGFLYQGKSFADLASRYGTNNADTAFDAAFFEVLKARILATHNIGSDNADADTAAHNAALALLQSAQASPKQLYYTDGGADWDNSLVWYGAEYPKTMVAAVSEATDNTSTPIVEFDSGLYYIAPAYDDSVEYLTSTEGAAAIPANATHVVRSYFFRGTAGGQNDTPREMLYFVVRVARSLTAPYQQTVTISAPASLLSVQSVLIDDVASTPKAYYNALVPSRVVYEVGLRSDINPANMTEKVSAEYLAANPGSESGTYYFYTNEWDRNAAQEEHKAMTSADFYASAENEYYAYTKDTPLYTDAACTRPATSLTAGETYYYEHDYYTWTSTAASSEEGVTATPQNGSIAIVMPADYTEFAAQDANNQWYIKAGTYSEAAITSLDEDIGKSENRTQTAGRVTFHDRTYGHTDPHYTIWLGNNGRLIYKSASPTKSVASYENEQAAAPIPTLTDANGKAVMVCQVLEYTIEVPNITGAAADITITDTIPVGTEFVSANPSVQPDGRQLTWTDRVETGGKLTVSFKVKVTEAALQSATFDPISNTASATLGGNTYTTNTVVNPPYGKTVAGTTAAAGEGLKVGDTITYNIIYNNNTDQAADVTVVDTLPTGTDFVSATNEGAPSSDGKTVSWTITGVEAGHSGVVSVTVRVNASAQSRVENGAAIT